MLVWVDVESAIYVNLRCCYLSYAWWVSISKAKTTVCFSACYKHSSRKKRKSNELQLKGDLYIHLSRVAMAARSRWTDQTSLSLETASNLCISSSSPCLFLTLLLIHIVKYDWPYSFCFWLCLQSPSQSLGSFVCRVRAELLRCCLIWADQALFWFKLPK